jgi:hypothetical protein
MSLNNRELFYLERESEGGRGEREDRSGQQAGIFKLRLGLGEIGK